MGKNICLTQLHSLAKLHIFAPKTVDSR